MPESALRVDLARRRRRLRLQGQALSRGGHRRLGGAAAAAGRCAGSATRTESFVADNQARDHLTHAELALDARRPFPRAARADLRQSRRLCLDLRRQHPERDLQRAVRGRLSHARDLRRGAPASSPTPRRPTPIAAPGGRRPATCWSASPTARRRSSASTAPRSAGAISFRRPRCRTRRRSGRPTTAATSRRSSRARSRSPTTTASPSAARRPRKRGRLRGIGIACYVESSGVAPSRFAGMLGARVGFYEAATIRIEPDGAVRAALGTHNHGQGHATTFAQILSSRLGMPVEKIDDHRGRHRRGAARHRHLRLALDRGRRLSALDRAAGKIVDKGKLIAAHLLEAAAGDVEFADGAFAVAGTDRRVVVRGGRARRLCAAQLSARNGRAGPAGLGRLRSAELRLQQRRACLRARDRSRHRAGSSWSGSGRSTTSARSSIR